MKRISLILCILILSAAPKSLLAQIQWNVLRSDSVNGAVFQYFAISASDDHNYTAAAERLDDTSAQPILVRTTNGGATWIEQDPHLRLERFVGEVKLKSVLQIDSLHVIATGDSGLLVRSSDGGNTWIHEDYATPGILSSIHFSDPSTGIITGGPGLILTTSDTGVSWVPVSNFSPNHFMVGGHSFGGGRFMALAFGQGYLYRTNDGWKTWDSVLMIGEYDTTNYLPTIYGCYYLGNDSIIAYGAIDPLTTRTINETWVLLSTNQGQSWNQVLDQFTPITGQVQTFTSSSNGYWIGGGFGNGMISSSDHGITWRVDTITLPAPPHNQFTEINSMQFITPNRAIAVIGAAKAAGFGFIVDLNLSQLSVAANPALKSGTQIYPNPTSAFVNIQSDEGFASVYIVDILGREVANGQLNHEGKLRMNVSNLRAGMYGVALLSKDGVEHITNLVILPQ